MTAFTRTKADGGSCFPGATMHFYHCKEGRYPMQVSTVGLDLAKNTMKLHGLDKTGCCDQIRGAAENRIPAPRNMWWAVCGIAMRAGDRQRGQVRQLGSG